jgi:putative endopeptidase
MEGLNINKWHSRKWLIDSPEYLKHTLKWICTTPKENVVALFSLQILNFSSDYLRPSIRNAAFGLRKMLTGVIKPVSDLKRFVLDIRNVLPDALCIEYAFREADMSKLNSVKLLIESLRESAIDVMSNNSILSKHTTTLTLEKIKRMYFEIGKGEPEAIPNARYYSDSIIHTIMSISEARNDMLQDKLGRHLNKYKSDYPCFIVNASYYEDTNRIVIPWGILQWPFYSEDASLAWNYGGIGATIGHEITHAFDLDGSKYSPRAVYREWWTRKNRNRFKRETRKVSKFYSKFKHYGEHLKGDQTLNEDWADLGGLKIALNALKTSEEYINSSDIRKDEAIKTFFISYGKSWKEIIRRKKLLISINESVHSPAEDRVDRIVPHFQEWVDAFEVKKGDALYIPENKRLKFF